MIITVRTSPRLCHCRTPHQRHRAFIWAPRWWQGHHVQWVVRR